MSSCGPPSSGVSPMPLLGRPRPIRRGCVQGQAGASYPSGKDLGSGHSRWSVPPAGVAAQRRFSSRTPRIARSMVSSSSRSTRMLTASPPTRRSRCRTPAGVSGPSAHRLATQLVAVLAKRWPSLSHLLVRSPLLAPETIRPSFGRFGSRVVTAAVAHGWPPCASSAHTPLQMSKMDSTPRCGRS